MKLLRDGWNRKIRAQFWQNNYIYSKYNSFGKAIIYNIMYYIILLYIYYKPGIKKCRILYLALMKTRLLLLLCGANLRQ